MISVENDERGSKRPMQCICLKIGVTNVAHEHTVEHESALTNTIIRPRGSSISRSESY